MTDFDLRPECPDCKGSGTVESPRLKVHQEAMLQNTPLAELLALCKEEAEGGLDPVTCPRCKGTGHL
jgi:hypothetical protein